MRKGFSLIELLIVVAIIMLIAAIAIPNLVRARIAANESSAVSSIHIISTAEVTYESSYPLIGFGPLGALGPVAATGCTGATSTNACLLDFSLSNASAAATAKSGYWFQVTPILASGLALQYVASGIPAALNQGGVRGFCANDDAVIRFTASGGAHVVTLPTCTAYTAL